MQRRPDGDLFSPSDVCRFMESPFATWMDRRRLDRPREPPHPDTPSDEQQLVARKGNEHERAFLERLRSEGRDVVEIPEGREADAATERALRAGREVVYQARLQRGRFAGFADFLVRVDGPSALGSHHYEVWDTKLARRPKPYFLIQLAAYADMLEDVQGRRPEHVSVVLGDERVRVYRTDDVVYAWRALAAAFLAFVDAFDADACPEPEPGADHGRWQSYAEAWMEASDHVVRVAGMTRGQAHKLASVGVTTMTQLADEVPPRPPGMAAHVVQRLHEQARLQLASRGRERPHFEVLLPDDDDRRRGLALLPPPSPNDVYADFEGYPLVDGGLEYLIGAVVAGDPEPVFHDWWAHDADQERRAFADFVDWLRERWQDDPSMHVYHYAAYEVAALRRLAGRHGTREDALDELLRAEVFVDLYTVVRQGLRVGEPSYSLKNVERLFAPSRAGDVTTAAESIVVYDRWLESGEPADWRRSPLLAQIREYNREDCRSTWRLAEWLRARQREAGLAWIAPTGLDGDEAPRPPSPEVAVREELSRRLVERGRERGDAVDELLGHLVGFHRREEKPLWWALFDRRDRTPEELSEDADCLGELTRAGEALPVKRSTAYPYAFDPDQDTKLAAGDECRLAPQIDVRVTLEELDRDEGRALVKVGPTAATRLDGSPPDALSLVPDEHVSAESIASAVQSVALARLADVAIPSALRDLLERRPPRVAGHDRGPLLRPGESLTEAGCRLAAGLQDTTLCLQGPPGTGKTTTAAHMIVALLAAGRRVGVTSNSHRAVLNLMAATQAASGDVLRCVKAGGPDDDPLLAKCPGAVHVPNAEAASRLGTRALVGGTAWLFSRDDMVGRLDHLFVDEAGQVSLANVVGMSRCAKNLVLIGDQMQLGQPTRGSHPGDSGRSALDHLLQGRSTIPAELGLFLDTTYRLHPSLCRVVSSAVYEGRLQSAPECARRVVRRPEGAPGLVPVEAGLLFVPVEHEGNRRESPEEAEVVERLVADLVGRELTGDDGAVAGRLAPKDILVVAPYNMQVRRLRRRLPEAVAVGSVDKFQGQQAAVVIVSMCTSEAHASPRGIDFLLSRRRLNVAISRARSLAVVVGHPGLALTRCATPEQVELVNFYCRIVQEGTATARA